MDAIVAGLRTKSAKIRRLTREGYSRQEIANYLGILYQHVRNVQVQSGLDHKSFEEEPGTWVPPAGEPVRWQRLALDGAGRVIIPAGLRDAMGAAPGSVLMARVVDGELRLMTPMAAVARAQKMVRKLIPGDDSLAQSLIEDRRREAADEKSDG
jgi:bifunctional DNA-binding transcriptional regulator/antitoxin component of YhaV-PrlF toxin-antitoxin module